MHGDTATPNGNPFEVVQQGASETHRSDGLAPVRAA